MVVLGLILLAAAVVAAVELILANRSEISVSMWNQTWQMDKFWLAVIGAAILLGAVVGLSLMRIGTARAWRLRRERRELAAENRRLAEHAATRDEVVEAAPAREPVRQGVADRLHHDRDHDGIDDRAEARTAAAPAGTYGDVPPNSPYSGPADRPGYVAPGTTAGDTPYPGTDGGRHVVTDPTVRSTPRR